MNKLQQAEKWASEVWARNVGGWETRNQDHNYRKFLVRPVIRQVINRLSQIQDGIFLDLGCGDGSEMRYIRKYLRKKGCSGSFFGFDFQSSLIDIAKRNNRLRELEMFFDAGDLEDLIKKYYLEHRVDRLFSTFLLQELPGTTRHLDLSMNCLKLYESCGVFLLLNPDFGTAMLRKGVVRVNKELGKSKNWRWAGEYPIVEEDGKTFFVPYFHRELEDYINLLSQRFGDVVYANFQPTEKVLNKCQREQLSPFYDHPGNVYYPEIAEIPSTLAFVVSLPRTMPEIF